MYFLRPLELLLLTPDEDGGEQEDGGAGEPAGDEGVVYDDEAAEDAVHEDGDGDAAGDGQLERDVVGGVHGLVQLPSRLLLLLVRRRRRLLARPLRRPVNVVVKILILRRRGGHHCIHCQRSRIIDQTSNNRSYVSFFFSVNMYIYKRQICIIFDYLKYTIYI